MPVQKRFKVVGVAPGVITVEDTKGVRQEDGTFPRVDYFGCNIDQDFSVGDWVTIHIRRQSTSL